jgi:hypothetical protein
LAGADEDAFDSAWVDVAEVFLAAADDVLAVVVPNV